MATQKGRNWSSGDIVTAANLSSIERGVSAVSSLYEPTTWANGDTVTAAALNKIEQGIVNADDGGTSWITLTEESVTTAQTGLGVVGNFAYSERITADTIKVTFNGTEYTCTKTVDADTNHYGAEWSDGYDFSTYPFAIDSNSGLGNAIFTETAGTYSVKIEAPQSGGSSDFSTVQMTVNGSGSYPMRGAFVAESWGKGGPATTTGTYYSDDYGYPGSFSVVMYKGTAVVEFDEQATITATGNATVDWKYVTITGDCTITIS